MTPTQACARCPKCERDCLGTCACLIDNRDISDHQAVLYCPLARFGTDSDVKPPAWDAEPIEPSIAPARVVNRPAASIPVKPIPRSEWPRPVRALAVLAKPGESGVGDTAQRLIGHMGGEAMKRLYVELVGRDCGCNARRERLNLLYPYSAQQA
jgi:hypothetical protein